MCNMQIEKLINELEKEVNKLKEDYENLEKNELNITRKECINDITRIRKILYQITQKIKDLIWIKEEI